MVINQTKPKPRGRSWTLKKKKRTLIATHGNSSHLGRTAWWACTSQAKHDHSTTSKIKATLTAKVWQENETMICENSANKVWHIIFMTVNHTTT
jgi:hypothetical protein